MSENRQIAAIMFTDIVGYTAMMQKSEAKAMLAVKKHRRVLEGCTSRYQGRVIQYYGDGSLSIYPSAIGAIRCAMEIQELLAAHPAVPLRIGIHIGEVLEIDEDIYGNGVNLAARIQAEGVTRSILISNAVHEEIRNHSEFSTIRLGSFHLKNVADPQVIHAIVNNNLMVPAARPKPEGENTVPSVRIPNNLPYLRTTFFGRMEELEQIQSFVLSNRSCTITGTGGLGKTRLAIELGHSLLEQFPDGVYFIDLVPLIAGTPETLADACLDILQLKGEPDRPSSHVLSDHVNDKKLLLILDNCEHLIEESVGFVQHLLNQTNLPHILATSRVRLNITGEQTWPLATLSIPPSDAGASTVKAKGFESIELFMDRARLVMPGFRPDQTEWLDIARICQYLDGIPLAIELAAARIRTFSPKILLERLKNNPSVLRSKERSNAPRQHTLENLIDWSYQLLKPMEQTFFLNLSVFADSFDLTGAEEVCSDPAVPKAEIIDLLDLLVDKSLVIPITGNRYRLLEVVKQFGRNELRKAGRWENMVDNLYKYLLELTRHAYRIQLKESEEALKKIHQEHENIINVLELIGDQPGKTLELVSYMGWYWIIHFYRYKYGAAHLQEGLKKYRKRDLTRGRALIGMGRLTYYHSDLAAEKLFLESIEILCKYPASFELATAYLWLGMYYVSLDQYEKGTESLLTGIKIATELGDANFLVRCKSWLSYGYITQLRADKAIPILERNLGLAIRENMKWDILMNRHLYADCALIEEDFQTALNRYREAFLAAENVGDHIQLPYEVQGMAMALAGLDKPASALFLGAVARQRFADLHLPVHMANWWDRLLEKHLGKAVSAIGAEKSALEEARGKNASFDDVAERIREGAVRF